MKKIVVTVIVVLMAFFASQLWAQAKDGEPAKEKDAQPAKEKSKEASAGAVPYVYTGPDTGFGVGASGLFRDLLKKEGRDLTFSVTYTQNQYNSYSIEWKEPQLFSKNGWGRLSVNYDNKPSRLFYGMGNDSDKNDICNFGNTDVGLEPRYDYWFVSKPNQKLGIKAAYRLYWFDPRDGKYDEPDTLSQRKLSTVFPEFYDSDEFDAGLVSGIGLTLVYDDRKDIFPVGGGRDEVVFPVSGGRQELYIGRFDKALGSDFSYTSYSANLSYYLPLGWNWTVLALRGALNVKDGDVPWWDASSFGSGGSLRGYHDGRFRDNNSILFTAELRQAFDVSFAPFPYWGLQGYKLTAPGVTFFYDYGRVYHKLEEMTLDFDDYHYTYGLGLRFIISPSVVIRADYAFSKEESDFYITAGWPF